MSFNYAFRLFRHFFTVFAFFLLAGYAFSSSATDSGSIKVFGPTVNELNKLRPAEAKKHVSGKTVMTYGEQHGTQIEYFGTDGMAYLWYPRNWSVVPSRWKMKSGYKSLFHHVCSKYPTVSYNPLLDTDGGKWSCTNLNWWALRITEVRKGDIFNLSSGRVPWRLAKVRATFDALLEKSAQR